MRLVSNSLAALRLLAATTSGLSLQELSDALDVPVASMHRLMTVLCSESFAVRSPTSKRFFIGPDSVVVSSGAARSARLHQVPPGPLAQASFVSAQSVALVEDIGSRPVCVALAVGRRARVNPVRVGDELPWYGSAGARALLLDHSDAELDHLGLVLGRHGPPEPAVTELADRVACARERGYELGVPDVDVDIDADGWSVAVPVRGADGRIIASVELLVSATRGVRESARDSFVRTAVEAAERLSAGPAADVDEHHPVRPLVVPPHTLPPQRFPERAMWVGPSRPAWRAAAPSVSTSTS